ncbi:unnamed protein product, partial [Mesorhabditis spiculigera]
LNDRTLIDPVKIKYILGSQVGPLSRILGGIRIDSVRVSQNREEKKRRAREKKASEENAIARKPVNDYGSIAPEQRSRSHSKSERGKSAEKNHIIMPNGSCREERPAAIIVGGYTEIDEPVSKTPSGPRIDDRAARQMFACDPSQLPKEMSFDVYDETQLPVSDRMAPPVPILVMQPSSNSLFETSQLPDHNPDSEASSDDEAEVAPVTKPPRDTVTEVQVEEAPEDEGYAYERLPEEDIHATAP